MPNYNIYGCDDGGFYNVASFSNSGEDKRIVWFGGPSSSRRNTFGNVFWGEWDRDSQILEKFSGQWWDVPFGTTDGAGNLTLRNSRNGFVKQQSDSSFGGNRWNKISDQRETSFRFPRIEGRGDSSPGEGATGIWKSNETNEIFFVTQKRSDVIWFAANLAAKTAHVFKGTRSGDIIRGEWIDIPFGNDRGRGRVAFKVFDFKGVDQFIAMDTGGLEFRTKKLVRQDLEGVNSQA